MTRARVVPLAILVVTALVLSADLGGQYVWTRDEARDGLVARGIRETGHWLIPHVGGRVYPYKPPLFHWLVALSSPNGVTEWSLRLPSALAAAAAVTLTYSMGLRFGTPVTGLMAAAVLASSATFVEWARAGRLEMLLVLWLTLALWSGLRWLEQGRRGHVIALGLALGLGCLTKGPVGLAPLATLMIAVTLLRRWSWRVVADLTLALAVAMALPAAWLVVAAGAHNRFRFYFDAVIANFGHEVRVERDHHPLFAVEEIGVGFLPWTLVLPAAGVVLARRWRTAWRALLLPVLWTALVLATFTIFISPRSVYFLPIYPALAVVVAWAWSVASSSERRWMLWPLLATVVASTVAGVGLTVWPLTFELKRELTVLGRDLGLGLTVIGILTMLALAALLRRRGPTAAPVVIGAGALLMLVLVQVTVRTPRANRAHPTREVAARFTAQMPAEAEVTYLDRALMPGVLFYVKQRQLELPPTTALSQLLRHPMRYALFPRDVVSIVWQGGLPGRTLREESLLDDRYVLFDLNGSNGSDGGLVRQDVGLRLTVALNRSVVAAGDDLVATAGVDNQGRWNVADLYLGVLLPDTVTIVFYKSPGNVGVGMRSDLRSFQLQPYRWSVDLKDPFVTEMPSFYSRRWVGTEPRGNYVFFHLAVQAGAVSDGILTWDEILAVATAPFTFR